MNKHTSLLRKLVNNGRKKFYNIGPWEFSQSYSVLFAAKNKMKTFLQKFQDYQRPVC
jgi:hypothetical protein